MIFFAEYDQGNHAVALKKGSETLIAVVFSMETVFDIVQAELRRSDFKQVVNDSATIRFSVDALDHLLG